MASTIIRNRDRSPLTREQIARQAPTVYADSPHASRSDRYLFVSPEGVLDALAEVGWHPVQVVAQVPRREDRRQHAKHEIRLSHPDHGIDYSLVTGRGHDTTRTLSTGTELVLTNSHDGSSAIAMSLGMFRLICSNGLVVPAGSLDGFHVRHLAGWRDDVIEGTFRVVEAATHVGEEVQEMQARPLAEPQRLLLAQHARTLRWPDGGPIDPGQLLRPRRREDSGDDAWRTLNVVQEHIIRGGDAYAQRDARGRVVARRETRPITGIDDAQRINRGIWQSARDLATMPGSEFAESVFDSLSADEQNALLARLRAAGR